MKILLFDSSHCISEQLMAYFQTVYTLTFTDKLNGKGSLCQYISGQGSKRLITFDLLEDQACPIDSWFKEHHVKVDTVVNNLEQLKGETLAKTSVQQWQKSLRVNLHFPFLLIETLMPHVSDEGQFIHLSSTAAVSGEAGDVSSASHKSALESLSKSLSREYADRKIRSNVIRVSPDCYKNREGVQQIVQLLYQTGNQPMSFLNGQVITLDKGETLS